MRTEKLLRKKGKKLWVLVTSERDEKELDLDKLRHNRVLFIPKPYDSAIIKETVTQIAALAVEEKRTSTYSARRFLARFLGGKG